MKNIQIEEFLSTLPESTREIIRKDIDRTKSTEKIVGIDPESYLSKEILWQSKKMIDLERSVADLTSSINFLTKKLNTISLKDF